MTKEQLLDRWEQLFNQIMWLIRDWEYQSTDAYREVKEELEEIRKELRTVYQLHY